MNGWNNIILVVNLITAVFMTGVIWVIQIVHYPLMNMADQDQYERFQKQHMFRISFVVIPPMIIEALTAILLVIYVPVQTTPQMMWTCAILLVIIWISTFTLQAPQHEKLAQRFDPTVHQFLVNTNWIRTFAWTLRSVLLLWIVLSALDLQNHIQHNE